MDEFGRPTYARQFSDRRPEGPQVAEAHTRTFAGPLGRRVRCYAGWCRPLGRPKMRDIGVKGTKQLEPAF